MSNQNPFPRFALYSEFDARAWSGVEVVSVGGSTVTVPTYTDLQGKYLDVIQFLNGYGITTSLGDRLKSQMSGFGYDPDDFDIIIDSDDKFRITNADSSVRFTISASSDNAFWGWSTAGQAGLYGTDLVASNDWLRTVVSNGDADPQPKFSVAVTDIVGGAVGTITLPTTDGVGGWFQNPVVTARTRGSEGDRLDPTLSTFEDMLQGVSYMTVVVEEGRVVITNNAGSTDLSTWSWISSTFRDRLGFSGNESVVVTGAGATDVQILRADNLLPGYINPVRPLISMNPNHEQVSSALRLQDGSYSSVKVGDYFGWDLTFKLQGPVCNVDEHIHFLRYCLPYFGLGQRITYVADWGDTRLALYSQQVTADQPAYDTLYTSEKGGYHGMLMCRLKDSNFATLTYDWNAPFRQFTQDIKMDLAETPV